MKRKLAQESSREPRRDEPSTYHSASCLPESQPVPASTRPSKLRRQRSRLVSAFKLLATTGGM